MQEKNPLFRKRHSLAHLLAMAVQALDPKAQFGTGPVTDNGFYYDILLSESVSISDKDFAKLEKSMRGYINRKLNFTQEEISQEKAQELFAHQTFKLQLIEEIAARGEKITIYKTGDFVDLCEGPHVENTSEIAPDSFKLSRLAGAYWKADEKNAQLLRIAGLAFENKEALDHYLWQQEEAKKRDHRILGEKLDLFHFDESIGKGLPIWLPKGNIIKEALEEWAKETETQWGYQRITTPIITKEDLFFTSGHLPLYKESMYAPLQIEDENYYIKPMNCPFHHKAFSARPKSYKELPVRFAEYGWCHRYEDSGSLFGLMRVRGMQMNDAHIYIQKENAVEEFVRVIKLHEYYYKLLGIKEYSMELALRDPNKMDKYHGEEQDWIDAEAMTIEAMKQSDVPFTIVNEGAAFYGPKMDFQIVSSTGRMFTASTNQLDLYMGKQFKLEYTEKDGSKKTPAIIHRAPLGTHERFIGFLIEHFGGNFPLWLAPVQAMIIPISEEQHAYANEIFDRLKHAGLRVELCDDNESLGKKIRAFKTNKIPYALILGKQEVEAQTVTLESRDHGKIGTMPSQDILDRFAQEIFEKK
jgi:threonyl-tRNA synthetase